MSVILFWAAFTYIIYVFGLFTALIVLRGVLFPKPCYQEDITPTVSMIVAAYNEEKSIAPKIINTLKLDYPNSKFELLIGSDGSSDNTIEIIRQFTDSRIRFFDLPRSGKNAVLNTIVPKAKGEILIFSDANSMYDPNAIRALTRRFADLEIGGVAGNQTYLSPKEKFKGKGERTYWNFDQMLKEYQSRAGNVTSATGAMYAIRAELFQPIPNGVDDFLISTSIIAQGYRLAYAADAVTYEPVTASMSSEYKRKIRLFMIGFEAVFAMRRLLNPFKYGFYALQLFTHKVLRRLVFIPLLILIFTSPILWEKGLLFQLVTILQFSFYSLAFLGFIFEKFNLGHSKIFSVPHYFVMVYTASFVAIFNLLRGRRIHKWETSRQTP